MFTGLIGVVSTIAIARSYGVKVIGEYALCMAPVNAAWFLSTVKERPGFIRELTFLEPRAPRVAALFWAVFAFSFALTLIVAVLAIVGTWFLFRGPIHQPGLVVPAAVNMAAYLLITNTCFNIDTVLSGFRAGRELFALRQHQALVFLGAGVLLGVLNGTVWGLIAATIASWGTSLLHRLLVAHRYMPARISRAELRDGFSTLPEILRFGLRVAPGGFADGVANETGTWVLGIISSISVVGAYNRAWLLGRRFMELNWRISEMLFPTLIERRARGDRHGFDRALVDTVRYCAVGMLWPAAAGGGAAVGVMRIFGPGFASVSNALIVVLTMPAVATISSLQRHALMALDRPGLTSWSAGLRMAVTVLASIGLSLLIGPLGTAIAVILGFLADSAFMWHVTRRHLATPLHRLWPPVQVLALVAAYAAGFGAAHLSYTAVGGYSGLALALLAGSLAYAICFGLLGGIDARDRARARDIATRIRARRTPARAAMSGLDQRPADKSGYDPHAL